MYNIRACANNANVFSIEIKLHQESILSPYIFTLVMDKVMKDIQEEIFWCILFVNDVTLIDESKIGVDQSSGDKL
jgi:hypothetical protein